MKLINPHNNTLAKQSCAIGPYDINYELSEKDKRELQKRQEEETNRQNAREAIRILHFMLYGNTNAEYRDSFYSQLAEQISELCLEALRK